MLSLAGERIGWLHRREAQVTVPEDHRDRRDGSRHRRADPRPFPETSAQPNLEASGARRQGRSNSLSRDGVTRPKSVSRFPSAIFGVKIVWRREGECHRPGARRRARASAGGHFSGREMPSLFIFQCNVERFIPRRVATPLGRPSAQPVSRRTPRMCSRSASASVTAAVGVRLSRGLRS
jgi:hypothetical protein